MHNIDHAIETFKRATGLTAFQLDGTGRAEILVDDRWAVEFRRIDDETLELVSPIHEFDGAPDADMLVGLLKANYLGEGVGAGRIAFDAESGLVMLCERLDVTGMTETKFEKRILDFLKHVSFWNSDDVETLLNGGGVSDGRAPDAPADGFVLRA